MAYDVECVFDHLEHGKEKCRPAEDGSDDIICVNDHGAAQNDQICYPSEEDIDAYTLHAGLPVTKLGAEKWILNRFFTQSDDNFEWTGGSMLEPMFPEAITYAL